MTETNPTSIFSAFWLYRATDARFELEPEDAGAIPIETATILDDHAQQVSLRAAYSTIGFTAEADLILWVISGDLRKLHALAADLHSSAFSAFFEPVQVYAGAATASHTDSDHGPIFLQSAPPRDYVRLSPIVMTPDWYQLDAEQRRRLETECEAIARRFSSVSTNVFDSSGMADQACVVALEADDPAHLIALSQALRAAEIHTYAARDTPVFLGLKMPVEDAISAAL